MLHGMDKEEMLGKTIGQLYNTMYQQKAMEKMGAETRGIEAQTAELGKKVRVAVGSGDNLQYLELSPDKAADTIMKMGGLSIDEQIVGLKTTGLELERLATIADGLYKYDVGTYYRAKAREANADADRLESGEYTSVEEIAQEKLDLAKRKEKRLTATDKRKAGESEQAWKQRIAEEVAEKEMFILQDPDKPEAKAAIDYVNQRSSKSFVYVWREDIPGWGDEGTMVVKMRSNKKGYTPTAGEFYDLAKRNNMTVRQLADKFGWPLEKLE